MLRVPGWEEIPRLVHGFCGRRGGHSRGAYADLNLSLRVGDVPGHVRKNWDRVKAAVGEGLRFVTMRQVHGAAVCAVEPGKGEVGEADGMLTAAPGLALAVLTADCVPILIVAPAQRVVAAVHAGWRGTLSGIAACALRELRHRYDVDPANAHVALGPAIGGCCYEVARDIAAALRERWGAMPDAIRSAAAPEKAYVDLRAANVHVLTQAGVLPEHIVCLGPCTRCRMEEYFSHRGAGGPTGRQLSFIGWQDQLGKPLSVW